ncbi:MAG: TetR family transcriptional regulator [Alphaproteobacteria bacterium]
MAEPYRSERRVRQRAANRGNIIEAARRVAERRGAAELSLRAAAAEAGYAPASVYGYFRNRAELVLALAAEELGNLTRAMRQAKDARAAAQAAFALMRGSGALAAAAHTLQSGEVPREAERHFNGKLIAALTALTRRPARTAEEQQDVVLAAATLAGLALFARTGRLKSLGLDEEKLLAQLERRFSI